MEALCVHKNACISIVSSSSLRWFLHATIGTVLERRIELASSFTNIRQVREAGALIKLGLSPYFGSAVRSPPAVILALNAISAWHGVVVIPFIIADVLSCWLAYAVAQQVEKKAKKSLPISPSTIATLILWNPCTVLTAAAAGTSTFTLTCVLLALYAAVVQRSVLLAAVGCTLAIYLDICAIYFLLPIAVLLALGPEDIMEAPDPTATHSSYNTPVDVTVKHGSSRNRAVCGDARTSSTESDQASPDTVVATNWSACTTFVLCVGSLVVVLVLLSEAIILSWPHGRCLSWIDIPAVEGSGRALQSTGSLRDILLRAAGTCKQMACIAAQWVRERVEGNVGSTAQGAGSSPSPPTQIGELSPQLATDAACKSWISQAYGGVILFEDLTPNLGLWWYFIAEMFKEFRAFFKFVLHSQTALFTVPIALRFHRSPLFSFFLHAMLVAIFKPYPLVSDTALYLSLLPLFVPVLEWAQPGILLGFMMLLAATMGPSTLYQWLYPASANSNFYYAFTMLWGGSQVVLMLLITHAVIQRGREVRGKPQRFYLPNIASAKKEQ